jgi:hypothetical protein
MDTALPQPPHPTKPEPTPSLVTEAQDKVSAFIASEDFVPFVLDCVAKAARKAVDEARALARPAPRPE